MGDIEERFEGRADLELSDLGIEQARRVATWIRRYYLPDYIISSPLKRARKTAEIIGDKCSISVSLEPEIMEWNNGLLAGLKRDEGMKKYPLPTGGRKAHHTYADTESYIQFRARAESFLSKLAETFEDRPGKRICLVSHGGFINMLFRSFFRLPVDMDTSILCGDTGVHLWHLNGRERKIIFNNYQEHIRDLL
jgi:2,3-bisphosphoglycerate-dependent phosphoglycerate mutase